MVSIKYVERLKPLSYYENKSLAAYRGENDKFLTVENNIEKEL